MQVYYVVIQYSGEYSNCKVIRLCSTLKEAKELLNKVDRVYYDDDTVSYFITQEYPH